MAKSDELRKLNNWWRNENKYVDFSNPRIEDEIL